VIFSSCVQSGCGVPAEKVGIITVNFYRDTCMYSPSATGTAIASNGAGQPSAGEAVSAPGGDEQNSELNKTALMAGLIPSLVRITEACIGVSV